MRRPAPRELRALRPNEGITVAYQRQIEGMIDRMHRDVDMEIHNAYREIAPSMAADAMPARALTDIVRRLRRKWERGIDGLAPELAAYFAQDVKDRTDIQLKNMLKRAGFTIDFKLTAQIRDIVQASISENVALIKSIPSQYFTQIEGSVMRSVQVGRDLKTLADELQEHYGVTRRRAVLISRDQNNKATAVIGRARQIQVGITQAKWLHSHGGREPRPTHLANSGKLYDVRTGWIDPAVGYAVWPGTLINCRCVPVPVLPSVSDALAYAPEAA